MKVWRVKELAVLAGVSVRTLHHYDKLGLLRPSRRQANDYRVYSENDLNKLQQIIFLKYLNFELSQIKLLLEKKIDLATSLGCQLALIEEKESMMRGIKNQLTKILGSKDSIDLNQLINIFEVIKMNKKQDVEALNNAYSEEHIAKVKEDIMSNKKMSDEQKAKAIESVEKSWLYRDQIAELGLKKRKEVLSEEELQYFDDFSKKQAEKMQDIINNEWAVRYSMLLGKNCGLVGGLLLSSLHLDPKSEMGRVLGTLWLNNLAESCLGDEKMMQIQNKLFRSDFGLESWSLLYHDDQAAKEQEDVLRAQNKKMYAWLDEAIEFHKIDFLRTPNF